jgi:membrane-bound lytic murein transglycosylase D
MIMNIIHCIPYAIVVVCCLTVSSCAVSNRDIPKQRTLTSTQDIQGINSAVASKPVPGDPSLKQNLDNQGKGAEKQSPQLISEPVPIQEVQSVIKTENLPNLPAKAPTTPKVASTALERSSVPTVNNRNGGVYSRESGKEDEAERDIMEEALVLLDESHKYWVNGEMEDALEMLDQAYALLLDTNGNPDVARQKDDLRLMISKRIMAIYNSLQSVAKGKQGEIPIVTNPDVEKEIRQFMTVERDFFISSYQRSTLFRPIILRELKKAGLPDELSWLPLVESGFKITALSPARALGLWQFIPSTGYKYGLNRDEWIDERMDVEKSTRAAIDYLKDLHAMFGDWLTVLAGYNCGEGRVGRTIASQHINYLDRFWDLYQRLPYETARYVPRFLATLLIVRDPQKYGMDLGSADSRMDISAYELAEIDRSMRLQDIAQKLDISEEHLIILNAELRHRMTPDRPYKLKVPSEKADLLLKIVADIPRGEKPRTALQTVRGVFIKHKVRPGETVETIALKYKTSAAAIRSANNLSKQRLVVGKKLNIPIRVAKTSSSPEKEPRAGSLINHKVQKGDTLHSLSQKYDIPATEIRKVNNLKGETLKVGQILRIEKADREEVPGREPKKAESPRKKDNPTTKAKSTAVREQTQTKKYTVKKGDSLNLIAREHGMTLDQLLELNRMTKTDLITPGQVLLTQ